MKKINKSLPVYGTLGTKSLGGVQMNTKGFKEEKDLKVSFDNRKEVQKQMELLEDDGVYETYRFIGTSEVIDRDGDVVRVAGVDVSTFKTNPVVLWAHDSREEPIGRVVQILTNNNTKEMYFDIQFAKSDNGRAKEFLVKTGFLRAVSIGFFVKEYSYDETANALIFEEIEVFEISVCSIPANQTALLVDETKDLETKSLSTDDIRDIVNDAIKDALQGLNLNASSTTQEEVIEHDEPNKDLSEQIKDEEVVEEPKDEPKEEVVEENPSNVAITLDDIENLLNRVLGNKEEAPKDEAVVEEPKAEEVGDEVVQQPEEISETKNDDTSTSETDESEQPQEEPEVTSEVENLDVEYIDISFMLSENDNEENQ